LFGLWRGPIWGWVLKKALKKIVKSCWSIKNTCGGAFKDAGLEHVVNSIAGSKTATLITTILDIADPVGLVKDIFKKGSKKAFDGLKDLFTKVFPGKKKVKY